MLVLACSDTSSDVSDGGVADFCGEPCLLFERVLRSARFDEVEDMELACEGADGGGWVSRALEERRGDGGGIGG